MGRLKRYCIIWLVKIICICSSYHMATKALANLLHVGKKYLRSKILLAKHPRGHVISDL